jgi:hypothetical protein
MGVAENNQLKSVSGLKKDEVAGACAQCKLTVRSLCYTHNDKTENRLDKLGTQHA